MKRETATTLDATATAGASASVAYSFEVSPETNAEMNRLAAAVNGTKSDVIQLALALFKLAVDTRGQGKKLAIVDQNDQFETEIVGL